MSSLADALQITDTLQLGEVTLTPDFYVLENSNDVSATYHLDAQTKQLTVTDMGELDNESAVSVSAQAPMLHLASKGHFTGELILRAGDENLTLHFEKNVLVET